MEMEFFDDGFDVDYSGIDHEDFGLAKSFTTAPFGLGHPGISLASREAPDAEKACEDVVNNSEIRVDGFNFKLHPQED